MRKIIASSAMAIALSMSINSAVAADFEPEEVIRGLVVGGEIESFSGITFYSNEDNITFDDGDVQLVSGLTGRLSLPLGEICLLRWTANSNMPPKH